MSDPTVPLFFMVHAGVVREPNWLNSTVAIRLLLLPPAVALLAFHAARATARDMVPLAAGVALLKRSKLAAR